MASENYHVADGKEILDAFFGEQNKPNNCGECARFFRDKDDPRKGYCDEWPCVLNENCVCHPNIGRRKEAEDGE